jgi:hypothetical protein
MKPTPRAEWVREGDRCISAAGWTGLVLRVVKTHSLPYARVRWDQNGVVSCPTITTIRKAD